MDANVADFILFFLPNAKGFSRTGTELRGFASCGLLVGAPRFLYEATGGNWGERKLSNIPVTTSAPLALSLSLKYHVALPFRVCVERKEEGRQTHIS